MFLVLTKKWHYCIVLTIVSLFLASCNNPVTRPTPNPQTQINAAVVATLAAIPTYTPYPLPTAAPSPTLAPLVGLFCEYGFCISHPTEMVFVDEGATHKPPSPGTQSKGILYGYTENLFIQLNWQISDPNFNPQTAMSLILEETQTLQGNLDVLLIGNLNVYYQPTNTITTVLPYGAVAAWQCGGRDFIWKVYAPQDGMVQGLLQQSLERFRCE
jgi:hypothetical protein